MTLEEAVKLATDALAAGCQPSTSVVMRLRDFGRDWLREHHGLGSGDDDAIWGEQ